MKIVHFVVEGIGWCAIGCALFYLGLMVFLRWALKEPVIRNWVLVLAIGCAPSPAVVHQEEARPIEFCGPPAPRRVLESWSSVVVTNSPRCGEQ